MCCFSVADVFLEDPPPEKKKGEKKEEKVKKNYVLVSDQLNLQPIVSQNRYFATRYPCTSTPLRGIPHHQPSRLVFIHKIRKSIVAIVTSPPFRNGVRHEPAIHLPSWTRNDT